MLNRLTTEQRNPASESIDSLAPLEIVRLMNREDAQVVAAVDNEAEAIAAAMEAIANAFRNEGRLIYIGAGTSGRLGVLDASECPPTFNADPEQVVGLIAGGYSALTRSIEGAEDFPDKGEEDLRSIDLKKMDVVVGIATSGRTPYVLGGLEYAKRIDCITVGLSCNRDSELANACDIPITPVVGPEVISGSTRLKAGTATKLVLNTLTTGAMVCIGKTYGNLMVDLRASNKKLIDRSRRIVQELTDLTEQATLELLDQCGGDVKTAVVAHELNCSPAQARDRLSAVSGHLRDALQKE